MRTARGKKLLLIGGGGHCKSVIDSILSTREYEEVGIIDNTAESIYQGVQVVGRDDDLPLLYQTGWEYAFITVGSIGNTGVRRRLFDLVKTLGFIVPVITDPTAVIAKEVSLGEGTFVGKNAVINSDVKTGLCTIINTGAIVEHDCRIGDFAHISPGAILCGQVNVDKDSHIGAGTIVRQLVSVGHNTLIGAGSVVVKDIQDGVIAYGNPCKVISK